MGALFGPLVAKILGAVSLALLLALAVQSWRLSSTQSALEKEQHRLVIIGGELDRQNKAVAEWERQGKAKTNAADKAVTEAVTHGNAARQQADRMDRTPRQPSGHCETPADVREIQL